jgi:hypothetical protein
VGERADWPCPATGLPYCPDSCEVACLRLADGVEPDGSVWPEEEVDPLCDQGTVWER